MDNLSLHLAFLEIQAGIEGRNLRSVHEPEEGSYLFYFEGSGKIRLLLSVRPGHPRIHFSQIFIDSEKKEKSPFEALLKGSLEGLFVQRIMKEEDDRLISFHFSTLTGKAAPDMILKFELIGRSSNLILTDGTEKVLGFSRALRSDFRQPVAGSQYQPPLKHDVSFFDLLRDHALDAEMSGSTEKVREYLVRTFIGAPDPLIGEIVSRVSQTQSAMRVLQQILDGYRQGRGEPCIYAPAPLDKLNESSVLTRDDFILSPIRIGALDRLCESRFETFNEAADRYFSLLLRNERFAARKSALVKHAKKEIERAEITIKKLAEDRKNFEDPFQFKKYGELILANMRSARREGSFMEVDDLYEPGATVKIPIDPSITLAKNAEAYFKKHRRAKRGMDTIGKRSELISGKLSRLKDLRVKILESGTFEALEEIMGEMREAGIAVGIKDRQKRSIVSGEHISGIRIYTSSDGLQILVGKSARENMKLSFKIASPEDFWLHASGHGGAHVVVKNPSALKRMPDKTLVEAARLAAFYSSGKGEAKIEVHYTKKKYVRKGRKLPSGAVLVKRSESIMAKPDHPFEG